MKYLFSVVAVVLLSVPVRAQEIFEYRDSGQLKGIGAVFVSVTDMNSEAERLGLRTTDILRDTELKLRTAGIQVETEAQRKERGSGYLLVKVNTYCKVVCGYNIIVSYKAWVIYTTDSEQVFVWGATIWEAINTETGIIGENNLRQVRDSIKDKVDEFINAYLTANPK